MKVFEIKSTFGIIEGTNTWTVTINQHVFESKWTVTIANEKGASTSFTHFGPLNNETVIQLLKDNLMFL